MWVCACVSENDTSTCLRFTCCRQSGLSAEIVNYDSERLCVSVCVRKKSYVFRLQLHTSNFKLLVSSYADTIITLVSCTWYYRACDRTPYPIHSNETILNWLRGDLHAIYSLRTMNRCVCARRKTNWPKTEKHIDEMIWPQANVTIPQCFLVLRMKW